MVWLGPGAARVFDRRLEETRALLVQGQGSSVCLIDDSRKQGCGLVRVRGRACVWSTTRGGRGVVWLGLGAARVFDRRLEETRALLGQGQGSSVCLVDDSKGQGQLGLDAHARLNHIPPNSMPKE